MDSSFYFHPQTVNDMHIIAEKIRIKEEILGMRKGSLSARNKVQDRSLTKKMVQSKVGRSNFSTEWKRAWPTNLAKNDCANIKVEKRVARRERKQKETVFTPLNETRSRILSEIKNRPGYINPPKLNIPFSKKNPRRICSNHDETDHSTKYYFIWRSWSSSWLMIGN